MGSWGLRLEWLLLPVYIAVCSGRSPSGGGHFLGVGELFAPAFLFAVVVGKGLPGEGPESWADRCRKWIGTCRPGWGS